MSKEKAIFKCEGCKKVILKIHPKAHLHPERAKILTMVDSDTGIAVVLPNVKCKHCGELNIVTWKNENLIVTTGMDSDAKKKLDKDIKKEKKPSILDKLKQ